MAYGGWREILDDLEATGKPFLVIVNTRNPGSDTSGAVQDLLRSRYGVESIAADCQALDEEGIVQLLEQLLLSFPLQQIRVYLPRWLDALEADHAVKSAIYTALQQRAREIQTLSQAEPTLGKLKELENVIDMRIRAVDLATGTVDCALELDGKLFYDIYKDLDSVKLSFEGKEHTMKFVFGEDNFEEIV